ncbi:unnamed protein product [Penicillium palitans]
MSASADQGKDLKLHRIPSCFIVGVPNNPCLECTKRDSACIFDMNSDKRRKGYASKMEEELGHYQRFLADFLTAIRDSDDDDVHHIINTVRSGSSASEIQSEVNKVLMRNDRS